MKKPTKKQKLDNCYEAYHHAKHGTQPTRKARDGSVPTHSVVPVPGLPEDEVKIECCRWLRQHHIFHNRHDCGSRSMGYGFIMFGIKYAGDIIGLTKQGIYFEIETKRGKGGRLSKGQQERMKKIIDNNGIYLVIHGEDELAFYNKQFNYFS